MSLLQVRDLRVDYAVKHGPQGGGGRVQAVAEVSFDLQHGETLGLVGESGCGKSSLARALVRLVKASGGRALLEGQDLLTAQGAALRQLRRKIQIIFQDPFNSLNPRMTVEHIVSEALEVHHLREGAAARRARVAELLQAVGLDAASQAHRYPHEFSGGQRQRIGIARALAVEPKLIICDEAVSALDVSVQAQIINLLRDLQEQHGIAYLFIAHDLAVVEHLSRRIMVMYLGRIVETGEAKALLKSPCHPYTRALISSIPSLHPGVPEQIAMLRGDMPSPFNPPSGCVFHPRCPRTELPLCAAQCPKLELTHADHWAACHFANKP